MDFFSPSRSLFQLADVARSEYGIATIKRSLSPRCKKQEQRHASTNQASTHRILDA